VGLGGGGFLAVPAGAEPDRTDATGWAAWVLGGLIQRDPLEGTVFVRDLRVLTLLWAAAMAFV
jgi:hypothetical protein